MTKRHRSFEVKTRSQQEKELDKLSFDLGEKTFRCVPAMPGAVILRFVASSSSTEEGSGGRSAEQILAFFDKAVDKEDIDAFHALIDDPDTLVELETLTDILGWLIEEYTGRPTEASKD